MVCANLRWSMLFTMFCLFACGCSYFQGTATDDDVDLTEIDEEEKSEPGELTPFANSQELTPSKPVNEARLKVGDRFPFLKTVEHRLTQVDQAGTQVNSSRTDVNLVLFVETANPDGRALVTAQFQRVKYSQDILGKRIVYASDEPHEAIPPEALLYSGLTNNGFSFWLGPNNKVIEIVGYGDFLRRCLRNFPEQSRSNVLLQLEGIKSADAIANFLDESLGMLMMSDDLKRPGPAGKKGDFWELEPRYCDAPSPLMTNSRCILKELTSEVAEVLLTGRITGSPEPVSMQDAEGDVKVLFKSGHSTGSCRINAKSGIPIQSQIQRSFELVMEFPDGQRIQQNKDTITTFSLMLDHSKSSATSQENQVNQTGFQNGMESDLPRRVVPAGFLRQNP